MGTASTFKPICVDNLTFPMGHTNNRTEECKHIHGYELAIMHLMRRTPRSCHKLDTILKTLCVYVMFAVRPKTFANGGLVLAQLHITSWQSFKKTAYIFSLNWRKQVSISAPLHKQRPTYTGPGSNILLLKN